MSPIEVRSFKYKLVKSVPESEEEFDTLAKEKGAMVREANRNILYRQTLPAFRNAFLHGRAAEGDVTEIQGLDSQFSIERKYVVTTPAVVDPATGNVTKEEVTKWDETEDDFHDRVLATLVSRGDYPSEEAAVNALQGFAQQVMDAVSFDPSKTERKSAGPRKTPQTYVEVAREIISIKGGNVEEACEAFTRKTGFAVATPSLEALAAAVWAQQKAAKKSIASSLAG